ncbi:MAG: hypothetical protein EZS28_021524, partial [Streblomastix strix]
MVAVVAVAVAVTASKYKKIGQGTEIQQFRESTETRIDTQTYLNIDLNCISSQHKTPPKSPSSHLQQHSPKPTLEETIAILRTIFPGDPRGRKEREPKRKWPKLQQYVGLMNVVEKFHEIMKPLNEEEKKKLKIILPGWNKEYPNKNYPRTCTSQKNNRINLMRTYAKAWSTFVFDKPTTSKLGRTYQKNLTSDNQQLQVMESQTESKNQDQLTNELERIVAYGTDDNRNEDQSEHTIEPKYFFNGNAGLRKNDSGTQLQATAIGEANLKINITKISANTPPHNVNRSDVFGGSGPNNETQHEQGTELQENGNTKLRETGSSHTTHSEYEPRNTNISQSKGQPPLISIPPELGQVKEKVVVLKKKTQPTNDHDTRSKTGLPKSKPDKSQGTLEARANSHTPIYFTPQQEQRKKAREAHSLKTSPQNAPKATRPVNDLRNKNKDPTP